MTQSPPIPSHGQVSSKTARKDADRLRKRNLRDALRDAGAPDPRQLDAAIVEALRDALVPPPEQGFLFRHVDLQDVLRRALEGLRGRTHGGKPLRREAVHRALANRLAPPTA